MGSPAGAARVDLGVLRGPEQARVIAAATDQRKQAEQGETDQSGM